ncbi:MAG TPA: cupin domain-containing protein [Gaiellales bacterium]|nr:cupin domain-containing protein [Gaiellales bacterium]
MTRHLVNWDELEPARRDVGELRSMMTDLGTAAGTVTVGLRRWQVDPGCRSTPPHAHGAEEELFYVLAGDGLLWMDGEVCEVRAGDRISHPPDTEAHTLRAGPGGLDVLAFGTRALAENCWHPHTGRVWAGRTVVAAEGPLDMWALDRDAGPLPFGEPGPRSAAVVNLDDLEPSELSRGDTHRRMRRFPHDGESPLTGLNYSFTGPGMLSCPPHCHSAEEELFVVLEGNGWALVGDEELPVRPGHVLARPPGTRVAHALRGGPDGITYLGYGTRVADDVCFYPRSNKIFWRGVGVIGQVERLDYWDGEAGFPPKAV